MYNLNTLPFVSYIDVFKSAYPIACDYVDCISSIVANTIPTKKIHDLAIDNLLLEEKVVLQTNKFILGNGDYDTLTMNDLYGNINIAYLASPRGDSTLRIIDTGSIINNGIRIIDSTHKSFNKDIFSESVFIDNSIKDMEPYEYATLLFKIAQTYFEYEIAKNNLLIKYPLNRDKTYSINIYLVYYYIFILASAGIQNESTILKMFIYTMYDQGEILKDIFHISLKIMNDNNPNNIDQYEDDIEKIIVKATKKNDPSFLVFKFHK